MIVNMHSYITKWWFSESYKNIRYSNFPHYTRGRK